MDLISKIKRTNTSEERPDEDAFFLSLRPTSLKDFIGQEKVRANLAVFIEAAKKRQGVLDHALFYGPPGLGKTSLAYIIAKELGVNIKITSGPVIERQGDLAAILSNLNSGDILFIDEIHRLPNVVEEILYPAMEEFKIDIVIGQGPAARSVRIDLPTFTLVGATTRAGLLTSPLRDRFGMIFHLDLYNASELTQIVTRSAKILGIDIEKSGAEEIARRSRGTPRVANRLLKRVRDFAEVEGNGVITKAIADRALLALDIDEMGLDKMDRKILRYIIEKFSGGPVGIETISASINEDKGTIEDVYEPFLLQEGFIDKTMRGRMVTKKTYEHFHIKPQEKQLTLKDVQTTLFD